ncbi:AAA family ATPase [Methylococcus sp. EFPC2]|uniref:AAA family ATPase n=1 Tax=Methylococcus sp. EFPC2 TaxID=2812648 RepID=UPI0019671014|nr:AAA family ATPase [Methylococcus sp. EFPC2]QSA97531.1 AAA family ATPase [Methylococcus sp. EFPC2]
MKPGQPFTDLPALAAHLRGELENKKTVLLYAYNGTGKTRLSMAFKDAGKKTIKRPLSVGDHAGQTLTITETVGDTLYFNAFTEDLFHWDNDLDGDSDRRLTLNAASRFFAGLAELEMDNRIRPLLQRYADFDFRIDTQEWAVRFSRTVDGEVIDNIKVSRGEENIFVWCFFLAIVQLALDGAEAYRWVKYVYIDDPISSLDEHNAIAVANHLAQLLKRPDSKLKTVISTHHTLFFNVLCNELGKARKYFVNKNSTSTGYVLREETGDTPFFHHVAALAELYQAAQEDRLFTHHFNMLRTILEKTASFHGHKNFSVCIKQDDDDPDGILHTRLINILSHGNYSLFEPQQMLDENKGYFRKILHDFLNRYPFNPELFPAAHEETSA